MSEELTKERGLDEVQELKAECRALQNMLIDTREALQASAYASLEITNEHNNAKAMIQELEAQAAAMREALGHSADLFEAGLDAGYTTNLEKEDEARDRAGSILSQMQQALSGEVGKALLKRQEELLELIDDLADSLRDFGGTQDERRGSMYRRAAEALDRADAVLEGKSE